MSMRGIGQSAAAGRPASQDAVARATAAARRGPLLTEPFLIAGAAKLSVGQPKAAEELFREARRRDPRSAAARYFLAQYYLATGRPVEGLAEASALTRLVSGGSSPLIPGLVQYAHAPGAVANLRQMFAANPALGGQVMAELARDASNAALLIDLADNDFGFKGTDVPAWQTQLLSSLIEQRNYVEAHSLWRRMSGLRGGMAGLFNPQFAKLAAPAPFNWTLGSGKFGVAEPAASGKLQVMFYGRDDGQFASQLLLLSPGSYQLRMQVARDGPREEMSGLAWTLTCQPVPKQLLALSLTKTESPTGALAGDFTVPQGCPAQLLVLAGVSREFAKSEQATISNLQLVRGIR
jgi:hypothetical protein